MVMMITTPDACRECIGVLGENECIRDLVINALLSELRLNSFEIRQANFAKPENA